MVPIKILLVVYTLCRAQPYYTKKIRIVKMKNEYTLESCYEAGANDAYYGYRRKIIKGLTKEQKAAYWNGYNDEPYGRKDNGYEEDRE
jgi:hypothetical protein